MQTQPTQVQVDTKTQSMGLIQNKETHRHTRIIFRQTPTKKRTQGTTYADLTQTTNETHDKQRHIITYTPNVKTGHNAKRKEMTQHTQTTWIKNTTQKTDKTQIQQDPKRLKRQQ